MKNKIKVVLMINGIFNAIGAILLFLAAGFLSELTGVSESAHFLWYLLGGCSLSLSFLAFGGIKIKEKTGLFVVLMTLFIFNLVSAIISMGMVITGGNLHIIANGMLHLVMMGLIIVLGLTKMKLI